MLTEALRNLKQYSASAAKYVLVDERLTLELVACPVEWDLNPHLQVQRIAREVAGVVVASGFNCNEEDVLLYWVTKLVTPSLPTAQEGGEGVETSCP